MQVLVLIAFVAAIQGLFLTFLLWSKKPAQKEHRILALLGLVMSIAILGPVLGLSGYYKQFPHLLRVGDPLSFLIGPLIYFYLHQLLFANWPKYKYFHFLM